MEDYIQFSAKTKSEAITKACIELGVSSDQLEIQVISEGSNGESDCACRRPQAVPRRGGAHDGGVPSGSDFVPPVKGGGAPGLMPRFRKKRKRKL